MNPSSPKMATMRCLPFSNLFHRSKDKKTDRNPSLADDKNLAQGTHDSASASCGKRLFSSAYLRAKPGENISCHSFLKNLSLNANKPPLENLSDKARAMIEKYTLNQADSPQEIKDKIKYAFNDVGANESEASTKGRKKIKAEKKELVKIEAALLSSTQKIHRQWALLKLLESARQQSSDLSSAIVLLGESSSVKSQPALLQELKEVAKKLRHEPGLTKKIDTEHNLNFLQGKSREKTDSLLNTAAIVKNAMNSTELIGRMDKDDTGLKHTMIVDGGGKVFELINSHNPKEVSGDSKASEIFLQGLKQNPQALKKRSHLHPKKENAIKGIHGVGGFGKVRTARDVLSGEYLAVKKIKNNEAAMMEFDASKKLKNHLERSPEALEKFLTVDGMSVGYIDKAGKSKNYLLSQLQSKNAMDDLKRIEQIRISEGNGRYEDSHYALLKDTLSKLKALTDNHMVHTDLKWVNIIGDKIADLDGLCYELDDSIQFTSRFNIPADINVTNIPVTHDSQESYDKHVAYSFGAMLFHSVDLEDGFSYSRNPAAVDKFLATNDHSPYQKEIIKIGLALTKKKPEDRITLDTAEQSLDDCAWAGFKAKFKVSEND